MKNIPQMPTQTYLAIVSRNQNRAMGRSSNSSSRQKQTKTIGRHQVGIDVILPVNADGGQGLLDDAATLATEVVQAKEEGILGPGAIYVVWLLDV